MNFTKTQRCPETDKQPNEDFFSQKKMQTIKK